MFEAVILGKGKVSQKLEKCRKQFHLFYTFSGHVFYIAFIRNLRILITKKKWFCGFSPQNDFQFTSANKAQHSLNVMTQKLLTARKAKTKILQDASAIKKKKFRRINKRKVDTSKKVNKNMGVVRSLDSICNPPKTITTDDHENDKPKGEKNGKPIFAIGDSMVKHLNGWEMSKKLNTNYKVFVIICCDCFCGLKILSNDLMIAMSLWPSWMCLPLIYFSEFLFL